MNFTSKIEAKNVSIYGLKKHIEKLQGLQNGSDYEIDPSAFIVKWSLEIEAREWGVKNMSCIISDIGGDFEIVYFDATGDEKERESVEFEPDHFRSNWTMEGFQGLEFGSLSAETLEINYAEMSVVVS